MVLFPRTEIKFFLQNSFKLAESKFIEAHLKINVCFYSKPTSAWNRLFTMYCNSCYCCCCCCCFCCMLYLGFAWFPLVLFWQNIAEGPGLQLANMSQLSWNKKQKFSKKLGSDNNTSLQVGNRQQLPKSTQKKYKNRSNPNQTFRLRILYVAALLEIIFSSKNMVNPKLILYDVCRSSAEIKMIKTMRKPAQNLHGIWN